jgi:hypothetical protein
MMLTVVAQSHTALRATRTHAAQYRTLPFGSMVKDFLSAEPRIRYRHAHPRKCMSNSLPRDPAR